MYKMKLRDSYDVEKKAAIRRARTARPSVDFILQQCGTSDSKKPVGKSIYDVCQGEVERGGLEVGSGQSERRNQKPSSAIAATRTRECIPSWTTTKSMKYLFNMLIYLTLSMLSSDWEENIGMLLPLRSIVDGVGYGEECPRDQQRRRSRCFRRTSAKRASRLHMSSLISYTDMIIYLHSYRHSSCFPIHLHPH